VWAWYKSSQPVSTARPRAGLLRLQPDNYHNRCPLRFRHAVRRSPVRQSGLWRKLALANSRPIAVPRARLRTSHNSLTRFIDSDNTRAYNSHHPPLTHRLVSQSALSLAAVQLGLLRPASCSPFLATIIGEYTLSRYIWVDLMSARVRAAGRLSTCAPTLVYCLFPRAELHGSTKRAGFDGDEVLHQAQGCC
jgi:hypothetical protein